MARADALTLAPDRDGLGVPRWVAAGAVIVVLHGVALLYLQQPPEPVGFESQVPIELDMLPPPAGEAQLEEAGETASSVAADAAPEAKPDEAVTDDATPPDEAAPIDTPDDATPVEEPPVAQLETPPDVAAAPPDVEPAVPLPPEDTVVAQEQPVERAVKTPAPVVKLPEPKREAPRPKPEPKAKPERETAQRQPPATRPAARPAQASQAGGRGGASSSAGASRAAALAYGARLRALVAAQQRRSANIDGTARVTFTVNRSGNVVSVSSSGPAEAAREVQAMVRRASFPSMPADMSGATAVYTVKIGFTRRP